MMPTGSTANAEGTFEDMIRAAYGRPLSHLVTSPRPGLSSYAA